MLIAQDKTASPLSPEPFQLQKETGIFVGIGPDFLSGYFRTSCDCPEFMDGSGLSWIAGMLYEQDFNEFFQWGAALYLHEMSVSSSYQILKDRQFQSSINGMTFTDTVPVLFRQKADLSFLNFNLMPYVKWSPSRIFFVKLGFSLGFNLNSNIRHTEEIINKIVTMPSTGQTAEVTFSDGSLVAEIENGEYPDVVSPQFFFVPSAGFTIPLSRNVFLSPVIDFHLPLNNLSNFGNGFKISSTHFVLELRWALQLRQG
jgi:hypothetical protein